MNIEDVNGLTREQFVTALGWIFEGAPWVAERAWAHGPFATLDGLHAAMVAEVQHASREEKLALLRAHPDLGVRARMSEASVKEQSGAGLDRLTPPEFAEFQRMNATYGEEFGFPFLFAVKGSAKEDILKSLSERLGGTPEEEFRAALEQVFRIARFRLQE
jgi:2-oxo-4-hydroxy-4-carboxy-5-ureidoimidazoline decarboxylase